MTVATDAFLAEAAEPFALIRPLPGGLYEPAEEGAADGLSAHQCPVVSEPDILDIVAWQWRRPEVWWLRLGNATLLGDHMFRRGVDQKLLLVETPAAYVQNRGECVCVVNWQRADLIDAFEQGPRIVFQSDRLRRRFHRTWEEQAKQGRRARYRVVA